MSSQHHTELPQEVEPLERQRSQFAANVAMEDKVDEVRESVHELWFKYKNLFSDLDKLKHDYAESDEKWNNFWQYATELSDKIVDEMESYRKLSTQQYQEWNETKRYPEEDWKQLGEFVSINFDRTLRMFGELVASLVNIGADIRVEGKHNWETAKLNYSDEINSRLSEFELAWSSLADVSPEKITQLKQGIVTKIGGMFNQFIDNLSETLKYDWDSLKNQSGDKWEQAKQDFNHKINQAKMNLDHLRSVSFKHFGDVVASAREASSKEWEATKNEMNDKYTMAHQKLEEINQEWHAKFNHLKNSSQEEWNALSSSGSQRLREMTSAFSQWCTSIAHAFSLTWYQWAPSFLLPHVPSSTSETDVRRGKIISSNEKPQTKIQTVQAAVEEAGVPM